jgi:hypothetical protein
MRSDSIRRGSILIGRPHLHLRSCLQHWQRLRQSRLERLRSLATKWLPILAMVATGIASILGAWESRLSNRKLWRVNNVALTSLYEIRSDIAYREKPRRSP